MEKESNVIENVEKNKTENILVEEKESQVKETDLQQVTAKDLSIENKIGHKTTKHKKIFVFVIFIGLLLLIFSTVFALLNINNNNIISGILIKNIDMKGLSQEQAEEKLAKVFIQNENKVILQNENFEYEIDATQIEFGYNIKKAVEEAYNTGRHGNIFTNNYEIIQAKLFGKNISLESVYNEGLLNAVLDEVNTKVPDAVKESSYYIDEDKLIITKGEPGNSINKEEIKNLILEKFNQNDGKKIQIKLIKETPKEIDIEKIHNEVYSKPKDAYYTKEPFQVFPHVDGIDFNIEEAKEILKEEKEEYIIPLTITHPNILTKDIGTEAFPDLLGSFSTQYNARLTNRTTNLSLAANKINGTIVEPGKIFSYNKTVGERTASKGFKDAAGYSGGEVVDMIGGGICQISSTLYDAVVYANLEIVSRRNHAFLTSYTTAGRDATVVYGAIDFQFKNTRKYPVLIKASVQNGMAKVDIYGIKEDVEYSIDIETTVLSYLPYGTVYKDDDSLAPGKEIVSQGGMNGCKSITYKIKKQNGVEVSREVLSSDTYQPMNKIIKRGPQEEMTAEPIQTPEIEVSPQEEPIVQEPIVEQEVIVEQEPKIEKEEQIIEEG